MTKTYQIIVTESQAHVLRTACEVFARIGMGQFETIYWDALLFTANKDYLPGMAADPIAIADALRKIGDQAGGIGSARDARHMPEKFNIAWDLNQVIRHRLAWDQHLAEGGSAKRSVENIQVQFDNPMVTSREPLAKIESLSNTATTKATK